MKKLFAILVSISIVLVSIPIGLATDICSPDPLTVKDFNVEITSAVFLRDISCMDSNVIVTLSAGEVVHVIGQTEGWHKIVRSDGTTGWIWETFVTATNKPFEGDPVESTTPTETQNEPLFDVVDHKYEDSVRYIYGEAIVGGYPDGSYQADKKINRAELLKIIVEAVYTNEFESFGGSGCFTDVDPGLWYTKYVCFGLEQGIVEGYSDGTFRPDQDINFVEALKIAMVGFGYGYEVGDPWYKNIVDKASDNAFIPLDINYFDEQLTRGQMADMIARILNLQADTFENYSPGESSYFVTFDSLESGVSIEEYVGTGMCVSGGSVYISDATIEVDECTSCTCGQGQWYCTDLCVQPVL